MRQNNYFKQHLSMANIMFLIACVFVAFYGLKYNTISNVWVMVVTIPYILVASLLVGRLRFDINFCFLMETFFVKAMLDQHTGRSWMVPTTIAMPMLAYLFGMLLATPKEDGKDFDVEVRTGIALGALTFGTTILGVLNYLLTKKTPEFEQGLYSVAFTHGNMHTYTIMFLFNFIFIVSLVAALCVTWFYAIMSKSTETRKIRKLVLTAGAILFSVVFLVWYLHTNRYTAMKEGLWLLIHNHWGNFAGSVIGPTTTGNMWLDYGREYGILVFITLFIFLILTIKDAIKLACNKQVGIFVKSYLLILFVGLNIFYFVEMSAYVYTYLWYIGLMINGMISGVAHKKDLPCKS